MKQGLAFITAVSATLCFLGNACQSARELRTEKLPLSDQTANVRYSLVYVIHGDGSYLYHDSAGRPQWADQRILEQALQVAGESQETEVFIFHQKPKRRLLFFIPLKDGVFYYYRNGKRVVKKSYFRHRSRFAFDIEGQLLNRYAARQTEEPVEAFLMYFGHEIPAVGGRGYHASYRHLPFNIDHFAAGLNAFRRPHLGHRKVFDLILLSTCNNGTPHVVRALSPYSDYIVASPTNLHLSHLDTQILANLSEAKDGSIYDLARTLARRAFDKLTGATQTAVAISLYDVAETAPFLSRFEVYHEPSADSAKQNGTSQYVDCSGRSEYFQENGSVGVDVFYRPARFGRENAKKAHSGWGCNQAGPGDGHSK